uniref:K Homology domain-containing protein n=1 Tax=Glossina brevipalpis TaxID=37001 RepID=A0A1A9W3P8_9MUSC
MSHEEYDEPEKSVPGGYRPKINEVAQNFLADLDKERSRLPEDFPLCALLIGEAFDRVYSTGRIPGKEFHADVYKQKPIKITQKVFVPMKQYPKFNFNGKILGPKGNSLRRLQEETQCKIFIKGRGSMRDRSREEELRSMGDPKYAHLNKDLYVEISTVAPPAECYARVAYALAEVRKYLIPDKNDEVSHEQLRETMEMNPELAKNSYSSNPELYKSVFEKSGAGGTSKFLRLLKHAAYDDTPKEIHYEPKQTPKHAMKYTEFEFSKESSSSAAAKRSSVMSYINEAKRVREEGSFAPRSYTTKPYSILKKFYNKP